MNHPGINHNGPDRTSTFPGLSNEPAGHQPYWADKTSTLPGLCNEPAEHQPYWVGRTSTLPGLCKRAIENIDRECFKEALLIIPLPGSRLSPI